MEQENKLKEELSNVVKNTVSSMRLFNMTSVDEKITDKQQALVFKLLEQEEIYLLDKNMIVNQMKDRKINRKEASAIIAYLWGLIAFRSTFVDEEHESLYVSEPNVRER